DDERGAVGARAIGPVGAPALAAGVLVQRHQVSHRVLVAVDDDRVLVENRGAAEAVAREEIARRSLPDEVALEVIAGDLNLRLFEERHPDMFAVGGGRGAGETVELVLRLRLGGNDDALPEDLARAPVQAQQHALLFLEQAGREKDAITPDNGRGMADA